MAVRYSKREQTKLVNRAKKLIAQGKTLNAACISVSEREGGQPAANTLANWVKAAGLPQAAPAPEEAAPATPKKRRKAATRKPTAAGRTPATEQKVETEEQKVSATEPSVEIETPLEQPETPVTDSETIGAAEPAAETRASEQPPTDTAPESVAELVHVRTSDKNAELAGDIDDLLEENLRLRTALNEANREIRAMRDLLVVYASR